MLVMLVKTCFQRDYELVKKSFVEKNVEQSPNLIKK